MTVSGVLVCEVGKNDFGAVFSSVLQKKCGFLFGFSFTKLTAVSFFFRFGFFSTTRCTLVQSAVLRLHVVRPSDRLSVTLVDQDHTGWKSWKLIARTISLTPWLFVAQRPSTYSQGNMGKFGGD